MKSQSISGEDCRTIPPSSRRDFLAEVGRGMITATIGSTVAADLGLAPEALAADVPDTLHFGPLEPLVVLLQETPTRNIVPVLIDRLRSGTSLRQLTAAAALANARSFGGEDYVGFHTLMALGPALEMARDMPVAQQPLPVLKVLYRNTQRIQEHGGRASEVLRPITPPASSTDPMSSDRLRDAIRRQDVAAAEKVFARLAAPSPEAALDHLLDVVEDYTEVHRVVLPYRAWELLEVTGREHAQTLLRQSVRYCVRSESWHPANWNEPRQVLTRLLDEHRLLDRAPGQRSADDAWIESLSRTFFNATGPAAAAAAAGALAEGFSIASVGEAILLTATQLVLRDRGRPPREEQPGKPVGSVHGDSIGVHASDSAAAWRHLASAGTARHAFACLILGAYQVAHDRTNRGGDFVHWDALPVRYHLDSIKTTDPAALLREADEAIRQNLQARAAAVIHRYGELALPPRPVLDLLLRYAVSEDGALHAEKYYRTATDAFSSGRPELRWRHLVALTRVTASEFGRPAPGLAEARERLAV